MRHPTTPTAYAARTHSSPARGETTGTGRGDQQLAGLLTSAGGSGRGGTGLHRYAVRGAAGHVDEVLDVVGANEGHRSVTAAGRVLAREALRSR